MPASDEWEEQMQRALVTKAATRRRLAALPYEEKIRRMLALKANVETVRASRPVGSRVEKQPSGRGSRPFGQG